MTSQLRLLSTGIWATNILLGRPFLLGCFLFCVMITHFLTREVLTVNSRPIKDNTPSASNVSFMEDMRLRTGVVGAHWPMALLKHDYLFLRYYSVSLIRSNVLDTLLSEGEKQHWVGRSDVLNDELGSEHNLILKKVSSPPQKSHLCSNDLKLFVDSADVMQKSTAPYGDIAHFLGNAELPNFPDTFE